MITPEGVAAKAKAEIVIDTMTGEHRLNIGTFNELHDNVDANTYGGLCDEDAQDGMTNEAWMLAGNMAQEEVHLWIVTGGLKQEVQARVTRALYDALSVISEDPTLREAIIRAGDPKAIEQAFTARKAYERVYGPAGLLPEVQAYEVIPPEVSKALDTDPS